MIELYYDSYSVAFFIVSQEMGSRKQMEFLEDLYQREYEYLHPVYKNNKKDFVSDVLYWTDYLIDKDKLDKEFPVVEKDFKAIYLASLSPVNLSVLQLFPYSIAERA